MRHLFMITRGSISSGFSSNSKAFASELENIEGIFNAGENDIDNENKLTLYDKRHFEE